MKLQIKVDDNGVIQQAVFKTFGCGKSISRRTCLDLKSDSLTLRKQVAPLPRHHSPLS